MLGVGSVDTGIVVHEQLRKCIYSEEKIQNGEVVLERKKNTKCGAI